MKAINFLTVLAVMVSAFTFNAQAQGKNKKNVAEVTFNVFLHCNDCVKKAESVVPAAIKGIKDFKVSLEDQTFWIQYDAKKNTKENIVAVLAKKGYDVKEVKPKDTHHASCGDHEHAKDEKHTHEHNHSHEHNHNHNHAH
ncbi:MAG: heavy-metal-associated domain-containing protein [Bacteroidales bacterium]|nr:heavy-metal-associated domain-containing protein [Bacteroidales bacterium]